MNGNVMSYWRSVLLLLLLVAGQQHLANAMEACDVKLFRLPSHFQPSHYKLHLVLNPSLETFSGYVIIDLTIHPMDSNEILTHRTIGSELPDVLLFQRNIVLNAVGLEIYDVNFFQGRHSLGFAGMCHDATNQILVIALNDVPRTEVASLMYMSFNGKVNEETKGLFKSSIESTEALVTNFKPAHARRVFPCFDGPEFKATFQVSIEYPERFIAVTNMPMEERVTILGHTTTHFKPTPVMSTYLLGFAVGEFEFRELASTYGTKIVGYAPTGWIDSVLYMLAKAVEAYDKVRGFFAYLPQPLKTISIVAVNMEHGAVENWGLITMNWDLFSRRLARPDYAMKALTSLTNAMVRFWLGNLVTMSWWDDVWVTEGLANHLTTELLPEIRSEMYTLMNTVFSAMDDDDDPVKSRPIRGTRLETVDEIEKSYDTIIYKKSEAIFRMFAYYLGKDRFNTAIYHFIQPRAYMLATADDWLEVLSYCGPNYEQMREMLRQWTEQTGYPIIEVKLYPESKVRVRQDFNLYNVNSWIVPISYEFHSRQERADFKSVLLLPAYGTQFIKFPKGFSLRGHSWFKLNVQSQGYYRVVYTSAHNVLMKALVGGVGWKPSRQTPPGLKSDRLEPLDRMQILSDFYNLVKRRAAIEEFGNFLKAFVDEENDGVVLLLTRILTEMHQIGYTVALIVEVTNLMRKYYQDTGGVSKATESDELNQYTRGCVLDYLVNIVRDSTVIWEARQFMRSTGGRAPLFLKHVLNNLPPGN